MVNRVVFFSGIACLGIILAGCTVQDVVNGVRQACNYQPQEQAVASLVGVLFPGVGTLTAGGVSQAVGVVCQAVGNAQAKAAAAGKKAISIPVAVVTNPTTGRVVHVPIPPAR
jgi:hypothetical protein